MIELGNLKVTFPLLVADEFCVAKKEAADVFMIETEDSVENSFEFSGSI